MAPSLSPCGRLFLLGCVLAAAAVLLLPGCGDGSAATADSAATSQPKQQTKADVSPGKPCPTRLGAFVESLDALRRQLAVGLSYEQYAAKAKALRSSYAKLPIDRLTIDCLAATGTAAEAALNKYIDGANAWGECLADASCTTATIEPVLQRKWRVASGFLSEAQ
jgi:hypothetical protein